MDLVSHGRGLCEVREALVEFFFKEGPHAFVCRQERATGVGRGKPNLRHITPPHRHAEEFREVVGLARQNGRANLEGTNTLSGCNATELHKKHQLRQHQGCGRLRGLVEPLGANGRGIVGDFDL